MKESISFVMLLDDDEATNFLHRIMVEEANITQEIIVQNHAEAALVLLRTMLMKEEVTHAILFLDINMPVMDGWLSLDEIEKFDAHLKNKLKIVMVSASEYPKDLERMQAHPLVNTHMPKPLEAEKIRAYVNELVSN